MGTLSGQTIQNTYDGLLKLEDSTNPITSSPQFIQDGLGNNTNMKIGTNIFSSSNTVPMGGEWIPEFVGPGYRITATAWNADTQNKILYYPFYDAGQFAYSAMTVSINSVSNNGTSLDLAFYDTQYIPGLGIAPKDLVLSGISIASSVSGLTTVTFASNMSYSGTGGGFKCAVLKLSNSGATPNFNITQDRQFSNNTFGYSQTTGYVTNTSTARVIGIRSANRIGDRILLTSLTDFQTSYSANDIETTFSGNTVARANSLGWLFHVVK
jgi:hypothetical protein